MLLQNEYAQLSSCIPNSYKHISKEIVLNMINKNKSNNFPDTNKRYDKILIIYLVFIPKQYGHFGSKLQLASLASLLYCCSTKALSKRVSREFRKSREIDTKML